MSSASGPLDSIYTNPLALRIVTACAITGVLMQSLDTTIANVALPYMQGSLGASRDQITWILTSYVVAAAIMTAPVGWFAARFGRKNVFIVSLSGFTIASMLCGAAQTLDQIILFRLLQGLFGASLMPLAQSIILDLYPPEKRGFAIALFSGSVMVAPILGPTIGGYLTDTYNWRWVFYINIPFGIAAVLGIALFFHDTNRNATLKVDWLGFALFAILIGALQLMLDRGTTLDWFDSQEIIIEAVLTGLGLYLFVVHLVLSKNTFIPRAIFADRNFTSNLVVLFTLTFSIYASTALMPPFLQTLGGYTVEQTGLLMAPRGIGSIVSMFLVGYIVMRVDQRHIMAVGVAVTMWATWEMSGWTPGVSPSWLMTISFIQGFGSGMLFVPMNLMGFATLPAQYRTNGTSLTSLMRNMGSAIGISVTSTILVANTQAAHAQIAAHINPFNRGLALNGPSLFWNPNFSFGAAQLNAIINYNAQVTAYSDDFLFIVAAGTVAFVAIYAMRKPAEIMPAPRDLEVVE